MNIGIEATGVFFPKDVETAADLSKKTGIPEHIIIEKFGLYENMSQMKRCMHQI